MSVHVRIDNQALAALFRSEQGPIMRNMAIRATNVQRLAKQYVGVSQTPHGMPGNIGASGGGHLRDEIVKRFVQDGKGSAIGIGIYGKDAQRALYHHDGTPAHVIHPRNPGGRLVFFWPKAGHVMFLRQVHHPGTRANPFLFKALQEGAQQGGQVA